MFFRLVRWFFSVLARLSIALTNKMYYSERGASIQHIVCIQTHSLYALNYSIWWWRFENFIFIPFDDSHPLSFYPQGFSGTLPPGSLIIYHELKALLIRNYFQVVQNWRALIFHWLWLKLKQIAWNCWHPVKVMEWFYQSLASKRNFSSVCDNNQKCKRQIAGKREGAKRLLHLVGCELDEMKCHKNHLKPSAFDW